MSVEHFAAKRSSRIVTVASASMVVVILGLGSAFTGEASSVFGTMLDSTLFGLKWYYVVLVAFVLPFVAWLGIGRYRNIRLGGDNEAPEFTWASWFSMLFAAGMGIGLIFWSVSEPLSHFQENPFVERGQTSQAAAMALRLTFFHWGLHAWAVYALVGLSLAYFAFRRGLPLTIRSLLTPVLGRHADGALGHAADVFAVVSTAFGVATSLGLGIRQMTEGLGLAAGIETSDTMQLVVLAAVVLVATSSAVSGVRRGVRVLSNLNILMSVLLLVFFLTFGPTRHILGSLIQATGDYFQNLIALSTWLDVTRHSDWQETWTVFYWAWWIAWSPFVGMFIARISRGRTIREFVMGVLLVPAIFTFVWLAITGGTALYIELFEGGGLLQILERDPSLPLFATVKQLAPSVLGTAIIVLIVALSAIYFITSCDSGTLVITTILSLGAEEPPIAQRIAWGLAEGVIAGVLLTTGGLAALQSATIAAALPFSLVLIMIVIGLVRSLRLEEVAPREGIRTRTDCEPWTGCYTKRQADREE